MTEELLNQLSEENEALKKQNKNLFFDLEQLGFNHQSALHFHSLEIGDLNKQIKELKEALQLFVEAALKIENDKHLTWYEFADYLNDDQIQKAIEVLNNEQKTS